MSKRLACETIFSSSEVTIPMDDVAFIEHDQRPDWLGAIRVVLKCSKWNNDSQCFEPSIWMHKAPSQEFLRAWCFFRSEIDPVKESP